MKVEYYDLDQMIADLKKSQVKEVRIQSTRRRSSSTFLYNVIFEVYVTAKVKGDVWNMAEYIISVDSQDKRRLTSAQKKTEEVEKQIKTRLESENMEVMSGIWKG